MKPVVYCADCRWIIPPPQPVLAILSDPEFFSQCGHPNAQRERKNHFVRIKPPVIEREFCVHKNRNGQCGDFEAAKEKSDAT